MKLPYSPDNMPDPVEALARGGPIRDAEHLVRRLVSPLMDLAADYQDGPDGRREDLENAAFLYVLQLRDAGMQTTAELEDAND